MINKLELPGVKSTRLQVPNLPEVARNATTAAAYKTCFISRISFFRLVLRVLKQLWAFVRLVTDWHLLSRLETPKSTYLSHMSRLVN